MPHLDSRWGEGRRCSMGLPATHARTRQPRVFSAGAGAVRGNPVAQQYRGGNRGKDCPLFRRGSARGLDLRAFRHDEVPCSGRGAPAESIPALSGVSEADRIGVEFAGSNTNAKKFTLISRMCTNCRMGKEWKKGEASGG